ncbi:hypothetical protein TYRP_003935 [Tyrophagus putrescentiae]|nr:hypothetical protein TYRP_003935 [Tyrophagus putrescentiae]
MSGGGGVLVVTVTPTRADVVFTGVVVVADRCLPVNWLCSGNIGHTLARFKTALLGYGFHLASARLLDHHHLFSSSSLATLSDFFFR